MRSAAETVLFSPREIEVASLLKRGLRDREIAEALEIEVCTVKRYLQNLYAGLNLDGRVELAIWCAEHPEALQGEWCHSPADFRPRSERVLRQGLADPVHKAA